MSSCWTCRTGQERERQVSSSCVTLSRSVGVERGPHSGGAAVVRPCCRSIRRRMGGGEVVVAMGEIRVLRRGFESS